MFRLRVRSFFLLITIIAIGAAIGTAIWKYQSQRQPLSWAPYSKETVTRLLERDKTVLVSLCAYWGGTGTVHERHALSTPDMYQFVRDYDVVPLRADFTQLDPKVGELMQSLGLRSVPAFIVYSPIPEEPPVILRDLVEPEQLRQVIAHAHISQGRTTE